MSRTLEVLSGASGGRLPTVWKVRTFERYRGKNPQSPVELRGTDLEVLSKEVSAWITLRNKVAHRCMPQITDPYFDSDAASPTIQAGWARTVLAVFLQLTNQTIVAIAAEARFERPEQYLLPAAWFAAETPAGLRGVQHPGALWGGHELHHG
ncbi:hypothetical protein [Saccharopolyspora sp. NPDC003762]